MLQKKAFLEGEGDNWFGRNAHAVQQEKWELVSALITGHALQPKAVLEIGCANGWLVQRIAEKTGARASGIDPSRAAISDGQTRFPEATLVVGSADELPFDDGAFDLVVFGFCLYLVDPSLHFRCVAEADRVLADKGHLVIIDFQSSAPYTNAYHHTPGLKSYKMEFCRYFLASPTYTLLHRQLFSFGPSPFDYDHRQGIDLLVKDLQHAFSPNPFPV